MNIQNELEGYEINVWYIGKDVLVQTKEGFDLHEFNIENGSWLITKFDKNWEFIKEEVRSY